MPEALSTIPPNVQGNGSTAISQQEAVVLEIGKEIAQAEDDQKKGASFMERVKTWVKTGGIAPSMKLKDKAAFFQMLSALMDAGIPILKSLSALTEQMKDKRTKLVVSGIRKTIEDGKTLSEGMEQYPTIFHEGELGMVKSGEASGTLNSVLREIAKDLEQSTKLASQVKGALIYPTVVIITMIGVVFVLMVAVIPPITGLFIETGIPLPAQTRALIAVSTFMKNHWTLFIGGFLVLVLFALAGAKTDGGRLLLHHILLRLPLVGQLMKKVALANFGRTLSKLLRSGVSIIKSLIITAGAIGNEVYKTRILLMAEDVKSGIPIGENIKDSAFLFPPMVVGMISVGEQAAQLDTTAEKMADFYASEVEAAVKNLTKIIEPVVIVFIGIVIGGIAFAIMEPLFSLTEFAGAA